MNNKAIRKNHAVLIPQINDTYLYAGLVESTKEGGATIKIGNRTEIFDINKLEILGTFKKYNGQGLLPPGTLVSVETPLCLDDATDKVTYINMIGLILGAQLEGDSSELSYQILSDVDVDNHSGHQISKYITLNSPIDTLDVYNKEFGLKRKLP